MASTSAMTPSTNNVVYHDWESLFDQHFEIMKDAVNRGDYNLIAALEVQQRLSNINHEATLKAEIRSLPPSILEGSEEVVKELEKKLEETAEQAKENCDSVKQSMEETAKESKKDLDVWEKEFDADMDLLKEKTTRELNEVQNLGKSKIRQLPKNLQLSVSQAYASGARSVSGFISKAVGWIGDALRSIGQFIANIWAEIKSFASYTVDWFKGAFNEIRSAFKKGLRDVMFTKKAVCGDPAGSFAAFEDLAKQLQNLGLENFTLARKGNSWVIETM